MKGRPFQIIGFDLLIDKNLKAWLLEINTSPSLNIYFDTAKNFMEKVEMTEEDICQVNLYIKKRIVEDTILLAAESDLEAVNEMNSLTRIHPTDKSEIYGILKDLRTIFLSLTPVKTKASITDQNFQRLS